MGAGVQDGGSAEGAGIQGGWGRLQESVGAPARHLGTEDDELVELVEEGVPPSAALGVRLFHDQLRINLTGQTKGQSGSAVGLRWT